MTEDAGRNFKDMDARAAQEALAEELTHEESESEAVTEEKEEAEAEETALEGEAGEA